MIKGKEISVAVEDGASEIFSSAGVLIELAFDRGCDGVAGVAA